MTDFTGLVLALAEDADEELEQALQGLDTGDWVTAAAILVGSILVARLVQRLVRRLVQRGEGGSQAARLVGRVFAALVMAVGFVYALQTLGVRLAPLLGALGIGGLALAFAAQSILENLFASVLLQSRRPFRLGDQIETNEIEGTVEDVNFRTVVLRTYAGERVLIPCSQVLNTPITNFTAKGTRRTTLDVGVAYGTDLESAQQVLLRAASSVAGVQSQPAPEAWVEEFAESSINFAVRWWHTPDIATMWRVRSGVAMAVKTAFDEAGIQIPFPQRTLGFLPGVELDVNLAGGDDGDAESAPV